MGLAVEFCGERYELVGGQSLTIGRDADVIIDDNPYLHRRFLQIERREGLWWICNVGSQLSATVGDNAGLLEAWLAPGAAIPIVVDHSLVWFTAGPTTYQVELFCDRPPFDLVVPDSATVGSTTVGRLSLSTDQRRLVAALAEGMLRKRGYGSMRISSSADVARRLGWPLTKFNRKLDYLCEKLEQLGVRGLHGGSGRLATDRRSRLVEYALATRLVTTDDLELLDEVSVGHD